ALLKALDDPSPPVRLAAAVSLDKLAPGHERLTEFRILAVLKQLDDLLVVEGKRLALKRHQDAIRAQQQAFLAQQTLLVQHAVRQQAAAIAQRKALAEALRPFNRQAALDPALQARYEFIIDVATL